MRRTISGIEVDDDPARLDFNRVHAWLASSYWSPDVPRARVEQAAANSASVIGAYENGVQIGYTRVVSDRTTFAWLCDVFVDEAHRGKGVGRAMVQFAVELPEYQTLRRWVLATRDAQGVYENVGFKPLENPERWMVRGQQTGG